MGGIGKHSTISNTEKRLESFRINSSCYGTPIPIVFGKTRIGGNIIDYLDFTAIPHTKKQKAGKGGRTTVKDTTYTYTVAVAIGICEGNVGIGRIWSGKDIKKLSELELQSFYNKVWPYVIGKYDERAIKYKNITYCAGVYDLGSSDSLPQLNFEVLAPEYSPLEMITNLITSKIYGVGLDSKFLGDFTDFNSYCNALGLKLAAGITDSQEAQEILSNIVKCTNSDFNWSDGKLTIRPYCENIINNNGTIYDPEIKIEYNLTDDDFIFQEDEDPVQIMRSISADAYNCVKVEFTNSANEYNTDIAEAKDIADIELNGLREADTVSLHYIHDRDTATAIAYMLLYKNLYVRNRCKFILGIKYCRLEPFDIVAITDLAIGYINRPVRILEIIENEDGTSEYEAEECLLGVDYSNIQIPNPNLNIYTDTTNVGMVNQPVIFTAPFALTNGKLEIWIGVSGKEKDWGGCQIWTSWDKGSYHYLESKYGPSTAGKLVNAIKADSTAITIDVSESRSQLYSVSSVDAANKVSLCYLDGEFFTYETAELIGEGKYTLKKLNRGLFNIPASEHAVNVNFLKIDSGVEKMEIAQNLINQKVYLKFLSFDTKGENIQYLDTVKEYEYLFTMPNMPVVNSITLTEKNNIVTVDFVVQQSNEYLYSEVYYREELENDFIYAGMDRAHVVVQNLSAGRIYLFKVVPVITNNIKGDLNSAKGQTIKILGNPDKPMGIYLDGTSTYIMLPAEILGGKQIFTIELKLCTTETRSSSKIWNAPCLCGNSISGSNQGDINIGVKDGKLVGSIALGHYGDPDIITNDYISNGSVYSISLVCDGNKATFYKGSNAYLTTCGVTRGLANEKLYLGYSLPLGGGRAEMILYEARFWEVARKPEELGMKITENEPGLRAWYRCLETSGNILKDSSSNKFDGTIVGNVWG